MTVASLIRMATSPSRFAPRVDAVQREWPVPRPAVARPRVSPEFVRAQIAIAEAESRFAEPDADDLVREAAGVAELIPAWADALSPWAARDLVLRHGKLDRLSLAGRAFLSLGEALLDAVPLRGVRLVAVKWFVDELVDAHHASRLNRFDLSGNRLGDGAIAKLLARDWPTLTHLTLDGNGLTELPESVTPLRQLSIRDNTIRRLPPLPKCESLDVSGRPIDIDFTNTPSLRRLAMARCGLATLPALPKSIRELDLSGNRLESLAPLNDLPLTRLSLRSGGCQLSVQALNGRWKFPTSLTRLDLADNVVDDAFLTHLPCETLVRLSLADTLVTDRGVAALCERAPRLTHLSLAGTTITDAAADALAKSGLRHLDISRTRIGRRGLVRLRDRFPTRSYT